VRTIQYRRIFFVVIEYHIPMPHITFPKGTTESKSKGLMTPSGTKPYVHIVNEGEFYRSYPVWKSKNPRRKHVYEFNDRLLDGETIMAILKQNMANATVSASRRRSPQSSSGSTNNTRRMVTRSMTRRSSGTSTSTTRSPAQKRQRTRKQTTPRRSYFE